jgi:hypothetical protein
MSCARKEIARIRRDGKRVFIQPEETEVHVIAQRSGGT